MTTPSHKTEETRGEEERWTIYVCPDCGKREHLGGSTVCTCRDHGRDVNRVEVIPASSLERVAAELDSRADKAEHAPGFASMPYAAAFRESASLLRDRAVSREEPTDA